MTVLHTTDVVGMDDKPSSVLRCKKPTSMRLAIEQVLDGQAQACVSAGNTGALMALAIQMLDRLPGVQRPAICTAMPAIQGKCYFLDLGANVDCRADILYQHALMGSCLVSCLDGIARPKVALLNIGQEHTKGNAQVKEAAQLLAEDDSINFVGYVEGGDLFVGSADVVVSDGFVGNIALKASEGVAKLIAHKIHSVFSSSMFGKLMTGVSYPMLKRLYRSIDPRRFNGASLLGVNGVVVKSHGNADALAFKYAIQHAVHMAQEHVLARMNEQFVRRVQ